LRLQGQYWKLQGWSVLQAGSVLENAVSISGAAGSVCPYWRLQVQYLRLRGHY
jgi:hypothetical protein